MRTQVPHGTHSTGQAAWGEAWRRRLQADHAAKLRPRASPELPGLMAASHWMTLRRELPP